MLVIAFAFITFIFFIEIFSSNFNSLVGLVRESNNMEGKVIEYFNAWNTHSGDAVAACFTHDGMLRDWDIEVHGAEEVGAANGKIFSAVPNIKIEVLRIHTSEITLTATAEILVHLNDESETVLKVADVIAFNSIAELKIKSVVAYKG